MISSTSSSFSSSSSNDDDAIAISSSVDDDEDEENRVIGDKESGEGGAYCFSVLSRDINSSWIPSVGIFAMLDHSIIYYYYVL